MTRACSHYPQQGSAQAVRQSRMQELRGPLLLPVSHGVLLLERLSESCKTHGHV